ncbi:hypothetical protein SESBI_01258 [Sesbania bispinosa]|nr:hypothetical protein SESBI_01258 [Sesbania bispinosa]
MKQTEEDQQQARKVREIQEVQLKKLEDILEGLSWNLQGDGNPMNLSGVSNIAGTKHNGNGNGKGLRDDAFGWVNRMEHYFKLKRVLDKERLQVADSGSDDSKISAFNDAEPIRIAIGVETMTSIKDYQAQFKLHAKNYEMSKVKKINYTQLKYE